MDLFGEILATIFSFIGGLAIGLVGEHYRLKHELRIDKVRRLAPYLEQIYNVIRDLVVDSEYAFRLQESGTANSIPLRKLYRGLGEYRSWFLSFRQNGMEPELESLNRPLYLMLQGVYAHAQSCNEHGVAYASQRIASIRHRCSECKIALEKYLKS